VLAGTVVECWSAAESFRPPAEGESLSLCVAKEKSDSGANGDRTLFASNPSTQSKGIARERAPTGSPP
jgi:hypothetical protein